MNPLNAYSNSSNLINPAANPVKSLGSKPAGGGDFANMVQDALQSGANIGRGAEGLSANALNNNASLADVVTAVSNAEVALQTVVSVRDKLVGSLQEILRMPV